MMKEHLLSKIQEFRRELDDYLSTSGVFAQLTFQLASLREELQKENLLLPKPWSELTAAQQYNLVCLGNFLNSRTVMNSPLKESATSLLETIESLLPGLDNNIQYNDDI